MPHITAKIFLPKNINHPKNNGIKSGYAPHHKFLRIDYLVSGFHKYEDEKTHYPGEQFNAAIYFPSWEYIKSHIKTGDEFIITEVKNIIGIGFVINIF